VVATPHFYPNHDTPERFLNRRAAALEDLRAAMAGKEDLPQVISGAEVYYFSGISESDILFQLTSGQKSYIMLEMPTVPWTENMFRELESIHTKHGITPIIAHIDRYIRPFRTHGIPERLEELPVLVQANGEFFLHPATASLAMRLLKKDRIHLLGSDCHNLTSRKPDLGRAVQKIEKTLGSSVISRLREFENLVLSPDAP
jgi:protein-tyrosine phosphatase